MVGANEAGLLPFALCHVSFEYYDTRSRGATKWTYLVRYLKRLERILLQDEKVKTCPVVPFGLPPKAAFLFVIVF